MPLLCVMLRRSAVLTWLLQPTHTRLRLCNVLLPSSDALCCTAQSFFTFCLTSGQFSHSPTHRRFLQQNRLSGQLPGSWGYNGSWPQMRYFYLDNNPIGGGCAS